MRLFPLLPALCWMLSCQSPSTRLEEYKRAAQQLTFRIAHVEPKVELTLPLTKSKARFQILLEVDNPTTVPFEARRIGGSLLLDTPSGSQSLGDIVLGEGLAIRSKSRSEVRAEFTADYPAVRNIWELLTRSVSHRQFDGLHFEGEATVRAYGGTWTVPIHARVKLP